jgi:hypothetical protein
LKDAAIELAENDTGRNLVIAASLKKVAENCIHLFLPFYFGRAFPEYQN